MTYAYKSHNSPVQPKKRICFAENPTCHDSLIRTNNMNSLILTNNMSHYDWFICVTWLIHKYDTIHLTCHDSLIRTNDINSLILTNNMSHYDWFICVTCQRGYISFVCAWVHDDDQMRVYIIDTGWLQSVGSIKSQVSFAEYSLFHRALLQKRPIILSILLTEATP